MSEICSSLIAAIRDAAPVHVAGRVASVARGAVAIEGLGEGAEIGAAVRVQRRNGAPLDGEIVRLDGDGAYALTGVAPDGVALGDRVILLGQAGFAPSPRWIGRVIDPYGNPLDGRALLRGEVPVSVAGGPPPAVERRGLGVRLNTGMSVLNTVLPLVRGQRIGLFSGSGVGKSRLLAHLARHVDTDIAVIALVGERGREVREFVRETLGPEGLRKSVVVAATSEQSALARRRCAWAAMSVAEYFRDQGRQVLFLADSVTRFAEAHREIAAIAGEDMSLRGFPPSLMPALARLCERAGPGAETPAAHGADLTPSGDITAVLSVLVAGSDMEEPVADMVRGVLDGHVVLSRDIAERGRFPAIDVLRSVSRALPAAASEGENALIGQVRKLLGAYEQSEVMIRAGLYAEGADPLLDQAVRVWPDLDAFFARTTEAGASDCFRRLAVLLRRAGAMPPGAETRGH